MTTVQEIVQTNAILVYLATMEDTEVTLGELAVHFAMDWRDVLRLLWDANTVDILGIAIPFDLSLPDPVDQWDGEGPQPGPDAPVSLGRHGALDVPELLVTFPETIILTALLDAVLAVTPPGSEAQALQNTRQHLTEAASQAGYGAAFWAPPQRLIPGDRLEAITSAIRRRQHLRITYYHPGKPRGEVVDIVPWEITTGHTPVLRASRAGSARSYRLDRIGDVEPGGAVKRSEGAATRRSLIQEDREARHDARVGEARWTDGGQEVLLRLDRPGLWAVETLPGARWHREGDVLVVRFRSRSDDWLASYLIQLGTAVLSIEPDDVAARMSARFEEIRNTF
ncbi:MULTISPECIES: WYL domain-containing protein [unclassified Actinobaculum]|uniref:WYL domain-containing protein n=1 Tax=unclassified Actinobaculum TaxID=2609299 RepID=UPI000D52599A|nr:MULTISPECIES: WYL domain-containing protein [unclassified Actinobaculum]AWE42395.1 hypothetical protein DDD63_06130 [Actinobaculum sp. 313]RTE48381.1 WYL domain-containing protein [Actinobaculum sp. 352]